MFGSGVLLYYYVRREAFCDRGEGILWKKRAAGISGRMGTSAPTVYHIKNTAGRGRWPHRPVPPLQHFSEYLQLAVALAGKMGYNVSVCEIMSTIYDGR